MFLEIEKQQMNVEEIRDYCMAKKGATESFPFDEDTLVFKVGGKMFLLLSISSNPAEFNVKCEPEKAIELRETYSSILPGFHMSKSHWNSITCDSSIPRKLILEMINDSYTLIVNSLPKKVRKEQNL